MNKKSLSLFAFAILAFSAVLLNAQNSKYNLRFKSGDISVTENISEYTAQGEYTFNDVNYVIIQFHQLPTVAQKERLKIAGVKLVNYLPNLSYAASIPTTVDKTVLMNNGVRAYFVMSELQKMEKNLFHIIVPDWAKHGSDFADVEVVLMDVISLEKLVPALTALNASVLADKKEYKQLSLRVPMVNLKQLAAQPWVMWMESAPEPFKEDNLPGKAGHRSFILNDGIRNLSGQGVKIAAWESADVAKHVDLYGRFKQEEVVGGSTSGAGGQHATQVSGTMVGGGLKDPNARGMAPGAYLYGYNWSPGPTTVEAELQNAITNYNVVIGNHAYGTTAPSAGCTGDPYGATTNVRDMFLNAHPEFINFYSAGNYQQGCSGGYFTTNSKAEKNTITVGAVTNLDVMTTFSSWGPVKDYRLKPDLVGVGDQVNTCYPNHGYSSVNGTSFSTPGVAGVCAQLVQRYRQLNANANPKNNLMKAILCNTAKDLGTSGPDYKHGYGRINALKAVRAIEQNRYKIDSVANAASKTTSITVPSGTASLKVMLTWNDPAATVLALPALVNDLNLSVIDPSTTSWNPWVLDGASPATAATRQVDALNNIEQVTIANPTVGTYQIKVDGFAVAIGNTQSYSITWEIDSNYIEVVYPAGNEKLKNGVLETIRWDKEGVTGTQTVEYSADSGATWNVLSSSVAAGTSHFNWSVPNIQTSKALVRVSSGSLSDVSDYKFTIIGVPAGVTAADDPCGVLISWNAVTGANGYDVMLLDTVNGVWNVAGSNVSGTSYAVGGLTVGTRYWFTVRARNAAQNIIGQRAVAINKININAGVTPTISVNGNVLSTQTATTYQWLLNGIIISGATSQNYTVTQPGNYSVTVTNSSGCAATSLPTMFVFTGLENQQNATMFSIYPNPSNGIFIFEMDGVEENSILVITNAMGQQLKVYNYEMASLRETIDLSGYDSGIYFVTLLSGKSYQTKKIIVNK